MKTQIEPAKVRELQKQAKEAQTRMERDNARAALREAIRDAAKRDYVAKVRHLTGNFA